MLLAIDASTAFASVALYEVGNTVAGAASVAVPGVLSEHSWRSGRNHTVELVPRIENALSESAATISDLTAIGVALGPGSFNGLRVGLATAKMLAFSLGIPLFGVSTLEAIAWQHRERGGLIRPVLDAGRGQVATALYRSDVSDLVELEPAGLMNVDLLTSELDETVYFCGEIKQTWASLIRGAGDLAAIAEGAATMRRAGYLADLCARRLAEGRTADVRAAQPLYLRRPPVMERAEH